MQPEHGDEDTKEFPFEEEELAGEGTEVTDDEEEDVMIGDEPDSKAVPPPRAAHVTARPAPKKKTATRKKAKAKPAARKKATAKKAKTSRKPAKNNARKKKAKKTKARGKKR